MATIYLDESGYTGPELMNEDQLFFVLASLLIDEDEAIALKRDFFSKVKAEELKHSSLAGRKPQQKLVYHFLEYIRERTSILKVGVINKKYALVCQIVDFLVEPAARKYGVELYDKGGNIAMANVLFNGLPVVTSNTFFRELLFLFQQMMRFRTQENYNKFFRLAFQRHEVSTGNELMAFIQRAHNEIGPSILESSPDNALDLAVTLALLIMGTWRKEIKDDIVLVHDASSDMAKQKYIWDAITSPNMPEKVVGWDRRTMSFPIRIEKTILENSKNCVSLQLADVIAGAFARSAKWYLGKQDPLDDYGKTITGLIGEIPILSMLPGTGVTPSELGTTGSNYENPHIFIGKIIRSIK